jgi:diaminopimelate decarboxylase
MSRLSLFPLTTTVDSQGHLTIGGCDTVVLARDFGTPLYIFDETALRAKCAEFRREFGQRYADSSVLYASKAFINTAMACLFNEEGLGLDVASGGEMAIASAAGFPMDKIYFHGNNKSAAELEMALDLGIGRVVVDNFHELGLLETIAEKKKARPAILLRLNPGVDPHTHKYIITGAIDSKFGFPQAMAEAAVVQAMASPYLNLLGLHFHIGSLIFEKEPYQQSVEFVFNFAAQMKRHGFQLKELNVGGGYAIQYTLDTEAPPVSFFAEAITTAVQSKYRGTGADLPHLVIEPGRAIVGRAGVALYTVGAIKDIPGVRRYVSVDGGMADNIRPAIYGSRYEALLANRAAAEGTGVVTIAGKFCESGDILIEDIAMPEITAGDIVAIPDSGAYCLSMASNYNASMKPAVVLVNGGRARLIRRRETFADLMRCDVI